MAETYTVKKGDTLYGIYGPNWKELSGYTGDPTKLQVGAVLPAPLKETSTPTTKTTLESIQAGVDVAAAKVAKIQAEVKTLAEVDTTLAPVVGNGAGDIGVAGAGVVIGAQGRIDQAQQIKDALLKEQKEQEKIEKGWVTQQIERITKREEAVAAQKTETEKRADARKEALIEMEELTGITQEQLQQMGPLIGQIDAYSKQIAALESQKQKDISNVDQVGMPESWAVGRKGRIERDYNQKIADIAVQQGIAIQHLQLLQGAYADVKATTNQIVAAATYRERQDLADMEWVMNAYQDVYNMESKQARDIWDRKFKEVEATLNDARTEKTNVSNLMLQYPYAGIGITDTLDEAIEKVNEWQITYPAEPEGDLRTVAGVGLVKVMPDGSYKVIVPAVGDVTGVEEASKDFWTAAAKEVTNLQRGESWGIVWNRLRKRFPNVPNETIDTALGGGVRKVIKDFPEEKMSRIVEEPWGWAEPGAYERFKEATKKTSSDDFFSNL